MVLITSSKEVTDELLAPVLEKSINSSNTIEKVKTSKIKGQPTGTIDENKDVKGITTSKSIAPDKAEEKSSQKKKISFSDKK